MRLVWQRTNISNWQVREQTFVGRVSARHLVAFLPPNLAMR
jgi:hypothetical protein